MGLKPKLPKPPPPAPTAPDFSAALAGRTHNRSTGLLGGTYLTQGMRLGSAPGKTMLGL